MKSIIAIIIALTALTVNGATYTVSGTVTDASTGEPLAFATVLLQPGNISMHADADGRWAMRIDTGTYSVKTSYIGFDTSTQNINVKSDTQINTSLKQKGHVLSEVMITARESNGLTSSSRIDRAAMEHLQPTSFTDLLELLPGNISQNPDMGNANTITLRETGTLGANGTKTVNDDYAISSLGTTFLIDGAPVNGDANLQSIPSSSSGEPDYKRSTLNKGVDMRTLSTDNIESVEIVRGIPSAEYGNLTSGLINIKRIRRETPFTARFKADEYSKLFSAGKGFGIRGTDHIINVDAGYLDSKIDPRDNLENYKRVNASLRANMKFRSQTVTASWVYGFDYTGSFDNAKTDPDLNYNKIDEYRSSYNRYAFTSDLSLNFDNIGWLSTVNLNTSASYQNDRLTRRKQVAPQRASIAPTTMEEGVHDGHYLLSEYIADYTSDGRPMNLFAKLKATGNKGVGRWLHDYKIGADWTLSKNYGKGQIYDLTRPLSASWTTRPRAYSDIPSLQTLSLYLEDNITAMFGQNKLEMQLGIRTIQLPGLDKRFDIAGKMYVDPRLNAVWNFPAFEAAGRSMKLLLAGGFGLTTRMPTVDYLFPQVHYNDIVQLNYYDIVNPTEYSRVNLRTYIEDATNYKLKPAINRKWEIRIGMDWGGNRLSVTYFEEKMNSGFRYSQIYRPYSYRSYDASVIDAGNLTAPPDIESLPYTDMSVLDGMRFVTNGSRIDKRGVEFQLNTVRWQPLRTSLIITGAWFKSRYSNSQMLYTPVTDVVGNQAVSDLYVGLYDSNDGRINEQFNTNFMFDTQIPRWGLTFSTTVQCMWWVKTTRLRQNGVPTSYISAIDGEIHPYTDSDRSDVMLQYLVRNYNEELYRTQRVPAAVYLNLKATKRIGKILKISAFVNRIIDYLPDYKSNGITIRRTSDAYFGMEANFTI